MKGIFGESPGKKNLVDPFLEASFAGQKVTGVPSRSVLFIYTYTFLKFLEFLKHKERGKVLEPTPIEEFLIKSQIGNWNMKWICYLYHIWQILNQTTSKRQMGN